jgi:hypothetical protein
MQTSIGIDVRNHVGFCCYNPFCGGRKQLFESARALSLHLARSPACGQFANECDRTCNARKLSLLNAVIVVQSSKRPMPLRRDVVNDITHIEQHDCENEVCNDWSDFNFPDKYGNKMDAYEIDDASKLFAQDNATDCPSSEGDNISVLSQVSDKFDFVPPPKDHPLMFTSDQKWTIALLKLLDDMNAPDFAFEATLNGCVRLRPITICFIHKEDCCAPKMWIFCFSL